MSQQSHSNNSIGGTLASMIFVIGLVAVGAVILLSGRADEPQPTSTPAYTLVGRNLLWTPSPTISPTPTMTWTLLPTRTPTYTPTALPTRTPTLPVTATPDFARRVSAGERVFQSLCSACHGFSAQGVSGLGPSMIDNPFINAQSNESLLDFVTTGRPADHPDNKSGIPMPARGGNPSLTDDNLLDIIAYIRSLNPDVVVPGADAALAASEPDAPSVEITEPLVPFEFTPLSLEGLVSRGDVNVDEQASPDLFGTLGEDAYIQSCAGCHGVDGAGVTMVAAPLTESGALLARHGIAIFDSFQHPVLGKLAAHPYRAGIPERTDQELLAIIGYLYSLTAQP